MITRMDANRWPALRTVWYVDSCVDLWIDVPLITAFRVALPFIDDINNSSLTKSCIFLFVIDLLLVPDFFRDHDLYFFIAFRILFSWLFDVYLGNYQLFADTSWRKCSEFLNFTENFQQLSVRRVVVLRDECCLYNQRIHISRTNFISLVENSRLSKLFSSIQETTQIVNLDFHSFRKFFSDPWFSFW